MPNLVRLWCLRHAESENVTGGAAGVLPLAPLTPVGRKQAAHAAASLPAEGIERLYCGSALRAQQTAVPFIDRYDAQLIVLPGLDEVGIGTKEGATDLVTRSRTAEVLRAWVVDQDDGQCVADGETGAQVIQRVSRALETIVAENAGQTVVLVGHVASLTIGLSRLCGLGSRVWGEPLAHALPFLVEVDGGAWQGESWPGIVPAQVD